jgi:voltage-gated potassium channel
LIGAGRDVAIVTKDRGSIDIIREYYGDKVYTLFSDYNNFDLLRKANPEKASVVFINLNDDTEKLVYIIKIKKHFQQLNYVVTLDNGNLKNTFHAAGVTYAISKNEISSKLLASYIYEPDVALFSEEIIAFAHSIDEYDMKQFRVTGDNPFNGMPYEKVFFDVKKQCNVVLIGLVKVRDGKHQLLKNPEGDVRIEPGDYLLMLMNGKGQERLKKVFHITEGI